MSELRHHHQKINYAHQCQKATVFYVLGTVLRTENTFTVKSQKHDWLSVSYGGLTVKKVSFSCDLGPKPPISTRSLGVHLMQQQHNVQRERRAEAQGRQGE